MKRTPLRKRKSLSRKSSLKKTGSLRSNKKRNGLKKNKRKKQSNDPRWVEIHKADRAFSMLVRIEHANSDGTVSCFTCSHHGYWKGGGIECGHYKSRSHFSTRWLRANAKPQCSICNQQLGGNLKVYRERLIEDADETIIDYLNSESSKVTNLTEQDVRALRLKIERKLRKIRKQKGL